MALAALVLIVNDITFYLLIAAQRWLGWFIICLVMVFLFRRKDFCYEHIHHDQFKSAFCPFVHAISSELRA